MSDHAIPCAACGHTDYHSQMVGCLADECTCETYTLRDRAADTAEGKRRGEEGGELALSGHAMTVSPEGNAWREKAEKRLAELIASGEVFTADDLTDAIGPAPSRNAIGGLFLSRKSEMTTVGFTTSSRPEGHGRALRQWQGLLA